MDAESDEVIQTALNGAIEGRMPGEYLVMGNWNYEPVEPGGVTCCIVEVNATQPELKWRVLYSIRVWVTTISRVSPACYLLGTVNGEIIRVKGELRETFQTSTVRSILSIWGQSDDDFWFSHPHGLSHWQGGQVIKSVAGGRLQKIHGLRPDFAVAVGMAGKVMRFDGVDWRNVDSVPTNKTLVVVFCVSNKEIYIGGWGGTLFMWNGKDSWTSIEVVGDDGVGTNDNVYTIVQYLGEIYIGVGYGGLYKIVGNKANKIQGVYSSKANVVEGKLLVTGLDSFAEFDGKTWRTVSIKLP